jgi:hypothetical protein
MKRLMFFSVQRVSPILQNGCDFAIRRWCPFFN